VEPGRVAAAFLVGAVVAGEEDECVTGEARFWTVCVISPT